MYFLCDDQHIFCSSFKDCPKTKHFKMLDNSYLNTYLKKKKKTNKQTLQTVGC